MSSDVHPFRPSTERPLSCVQCGLPKHHQRHNYGQVEFEYGDEARGYKPPDPQVAEPAMRAFREMRDRLEKGRKDDEDKIDWAAMPWRALELAAAAMTYGANKYERDDYLKGIEWTRLWSAGIRHMTAWFDREEEDPESGMPHLAHAACCVLMLLELQMRGKGEDDRYADLSDPTHP